MPQGLFMGSPGVTAFRVNARLPERLAGSYGIGFVTAHCFVGLVKLLGMSAFTAYKCRRYACGAAVNAGRCNSYRVLGMMYHFALAVGRTTLCMM